MAELNELCNRITTELDLLGPALRITSLSATQSEALGALAASLRNTVATIESKTGSHRHFWSEQIWKASERNRTKAQAAIQTVLSGDHFGSSAVFRRNIKLIFQGPPESNFDSKDTVWRKTVIKKRCERIMQLSTDGIISWAIAYSPTNWNPCFMSNDMFSCLLEDIEPADRKLWPPAVCDTLSKLAEEELRECRNLQKLVSELSQPLHGMDCGSQDLRPPAVRSSLQHQSLDREMKHMFTDAPAQNVAKLPQPFRTAVLSSAQWKSERARGYGTTACMATLFPKDETQDVSFTIWCGHNEGYRINDVYGVKHAISS